MIRTGIAARIAGGELEYVGVMPGCGGGSTGLSGIPGGAPCVRWAKLPGRQAAPSQAGPRRRPAAPKSSPLPTARGRVAKAS